MTDSDFVPTLWVVETANVLLMATRRGRIREDLQALPVNIDDVGTVTTIVEGHSASRPCTKHEGLERVNGIGPVTRVNIEQAGFCVK